MKRLFLIAACAFGTAAMAETPEDCASVSQDLVRLACYDRIFKSEPETPNTIGGWSISESTDDLTGKPIILARSTAPNTMTCSRTFAPELILRCANGELNMYVYHRCYAPGRNDRIPIEYRIDSGSVLKRQAIPDNSERAFGYWDNISAQRWLRPLIGAESLAVRFTPYREPPETIVFDIRQTEDVRERLRTQCSDID